ncbi:hypothetical protein GF340_02690, partial [Candidatus Peregrinibacteria bacterium]|nr:hypothetical protein [Candidatus Peregrinibacteria bacterium]
MRRLDEQFVREYFLPLIEEVLKDMGNPDSKRGEPLRTLLTGDEVQESWKKNILMRDYFTGADRQKNTKIPFTGKSEEDRILRESFFNQLTDEMKMRYRLSGTNGVMEAYIPDENRLIGSNQQLTKNVYRLALRMIQQFQNEQAKLLLQTEGNYTEENKEEIDNGNAKVVEIEGKEQVLFQKDIENNEIDGETDVFPMVPPAVEDILYRGDAKKLVSLDIPENPVPIKVKDLGDQFKIAQTESALALVERMGFQVQGDPIIGADGKITFETKDIIGFKSEKDNKQKNPDTLLITIDPAKPNTDKNKILMEFVEGEMTGEKIYLSQTDFEKNFKGEKRQSARNYFKKYVDRYAGSKAKERYVLPPKVDAKVRMPGPAEGDEFEAPELGLKPQIPEVKPDIGAIDRQLDEAKIQGYQQMIVSPGTPVAAHSTVKKTKKGKK